MEVGARRHLKPSGIKHKMTISTVSAWSSTYQHTTVRMEVPHRSNQTSPDKLETLKGLL